MRSYERRPLILTAAFLTMAALAINSLNNGSCEGEQTITIDGGDTIWEYARDLNPDGRLNTQSIVSEILEMNDSLSPEAATLIPGEQVKIPRTCS